MRSPAIPNDSRFSRAGLSRSQDAGVRRLVYLSSASVHGQAPAPGTDEESLFETRQPIAYNMAKAWAERAYRPARQWLG